MRSDSFRAKPVFLYILLSICLLLQGCSYKAWYGGLQQKQRQDCYELGSQSDLQSCLQKSDMSYEQYKISREELLKK
jgi:hypothetical protein